jgi:uncharacterized protein YegP (UPF0339 family)
MAGKFEVYMDGHGKHRFRLKSGNGQIIAVGEAHESMAACMDGIEAMRGEAATATVVDMTADSGMTAKPAAKPGGKRKASMTH